MTLTRYLGLASVIVVPGLMISVTATAPPAEQSIPTMQRPAEFPPIEIAPEPPAALITWDLPVARNERVDFFIRWLSGHNREQTALWLARSGRYGPMTREQLRARGMPEDLSYLALIERGFSPAATSRAKATGLWQFIEETGRRYGLKVTPYVDERRDPVKATDAALDYLQALYARFGSWYLAAAAYNTGENRVERILREQTGSARGEEAQYWQIAPFLPRETQDYVPMILAAGHIGKEPARYGFEDLEYQAPLTFDTVRAPGGISLELIATAAGVSATEIFDLNQQYVLKVTPPGTLADVRIPQGRSPVFDANFARLEQDARLASLKRPPAIVTAHASVRSRSAQSNIRTVRATSPAFIARKASLTSSSLPRRVTISSSFKRP
jgi:membrane-bound lytic murein transglycosylase D